MSRAVAKRQAPERQGSGGAHHPAESAESTADASQLGGIFAGFRVATGTRYIFQWLNTVNYAETDIRGKSGWAQIVHASPPHPHNRTEGSAPVAPALPEGTRLRVHLCNHHPCGSSDNTVFHVLEESVCDWCGSSGYDIGSFGPPHRHLVPHLGVLVLHWLGGVLRCEGCVDLDEPPHSPNNRQRFAARLLHNNVLPVAARVEPVCALIAKFVVENSA